MHHKQIRDKAGRVAGDVEKDFWLAYDLLRSPKDHAEFTTVRDWVHAALQARLPDGTV